MIHIYDDSMLKRPLQTRQDRINGIRYSVIKSANNKIFLWNRIYDRYDRKFIIPSEKLIKSLKKTYY